MNKINSDPFAIERTMENDPNGSKWYQFRRGRDIHPNAPQRYYNQEVTLMQPVLVYSNRTVFLRCFTLNIHGK